ncbi:MAG: hypothetical protein AABX30_00055 [Nanoarchaeota archaeon]
MKYEPKIEMKYKPISPGTAGIAQRISSNEIGKKETSKLFALMRNELMVCSQNQY